MRLPVRCLEILSAESAHLELARIGVDPSGIRSMIPKQFHYNLKVESLTPALVKALAEEVEKSGGEAAFGPDVSVDGGSSAILSGTVEEFRSLIQGLRSASSVDGGPVQALAAGIDKALYALLGNGVLLKGRKRSWTLGARTLIMGILNATPDSFYDGGSFKDKAAAVERALKMCEEGADWIDVGGESTRPGALPVEEAEELRRVVPVIEALAGKDITVSVDTTKAAVARAALEAGAEIVNDVSAMGLDPDMAGVCAEYGAAVILMHMRGTPRTMQKDVEYGDLAGEVFAYLNSRVEYAEECGIGTDKTVIDPGIGFGKSAEGNLELVRQAPGFRTLGRPVLIGASRKSFIGKVSGAGQNDRLPGSLAILTAAVLGGAHILRVHDVKESVQAARIADALKGDAAG